MRKAKVKPVIVVSIIGGGVLLLDPEAFGRLQKGAPEKRLLSMGALFGSPVWVYRGALQKVTEVLKRCTTNEEPPRARARSRAS